MVPMIWAFFFYAILQNIARSDLKKSEDRYRKLFEESNDLIVIHKKGKIIDVNQKMCYVLGYSKNQLLNMSIQGIIRDISKRKQAEKESFWNKSSSRHRKWKP
jgi:transcriptional regulator with PAS, ATPase and Fis domain